MYLRRRAASAALALTAVFSVAACTEADNGNNTFADDPTSSAPATPQGGPQTTPPPVQPGEDIQLEAKDNEFVPAILSTPAGDITIVMKNTGVAPHTFTNADLGVDVNAEGGKTVNVEIKGAKAGKYHFICKYHETLKMVGDLTVT